MLPDVQGEELAAKISENEQLHSKASFCLLLDLISHCLDVWNVSKVSESDSPTQRQNNNIRTVRIINESILFIYSYYVEYNEL